MNQYLLFAIGLALFLFLRDLTPKEGYFGYYRGGRPAGNYHYPYGLGYYHRGHYPFRYRYRNYPWWRSRRYSWWGW